MSHDTRKQRTLEFYDIVRLPTVEMNGLAVNYGVTNAGTLGYVVTTLEHIGFSVDDQADKLWWPLAHITNIRTGSTVDGAVWDVRVWIRDIEDPNRYTMSVESFEKLNQAWLPYNS